MPQAGGGGGGGGILFLDSISILLSLALSWSLCPHPHPKGGFSKLLAAQQTPTLQLTAPGLPVHPVPAGPARMTLSSRERPPV